MQQSLSNQNYTGLIVSKPFGFGTAFLSTSHSFSLGMIRMSSFQIAIKPSRRAAGRFINRVRRALQEALAEENQRAKVTQSDVARAIEVHRSVISRELNGRQDITLGRVGEIAWALGREITFELKKPTVVPGDNKLQPATPAVAMVSNWDKSIVGNAVVASTQVDDPRKGVLVPA